MRLGRITATNQIHMSRFTEQNSRNILIRLSTQYIFNELTPLEGTSKNLPSTRKPENRKHKNRVARDRRVQVGNADAPDQTTNGRHTPSVTYNI